MQLHLNTSYFVNKTQVQLLSLTQPLSDIIHSPHSQLVHANIPLQQQPLTSHDVGRKPEELQSAFLQALAYTLNCYVCTYLWTSQTHAIITIFS